MSRLTSHEANDIRDFLGRMAREVPAAVPAPKGSVRRARRRLAMTVAAGVVVVALAGYGALALVDVAREWARPIPASSVRTPVPTPSTSATPSGTYVRGSASVELSRYVFPTFEGPKVASRFDLVVGKPWTLTPMAKTFDMSAEDLLGAGIVDAYVNFWSEPAWAGFSDWRKDLLSVAMLFKDAAGARQGFALFDVETSWQRYRWLPTRGLGEEAIAAEGQVHGKATVIYVWRADNLVLVVVSQGSLSPAVVGPLADQMQARVDSFNPSP